MNNNHTDATTPNTLESLLAHLNQRGLLANPRHAAAFSAVPRHLFLPNLPPEQVYVDDAIPVKYDADGRVISSSSQPSMMLLMLNQLGLAPGQNVLEIGTGTGYNAAIMQHIVGQQGKVTSVEYDPLIARQAIDNLQQAQYYNVLVVTEDGAAGYSPRASYDRIMCTVGVWDIPTAWVKQLRPDGRIVAPIALDAIQVSAAFEIENIANGETLYSDHAIPCGFVLMQGVSAVDGWHKQVGSSALHLVGEAVDQIDAAALHLLLSADQDQCYLGEALSADDIWHGLAMYIMLNHPPDYPFTLYNVGKDQKAYGIEGAGIAVFSPGSACLIPYNGKGLTYCFAGSDAFVMVEDLLQAWVDMGKPTTEDLRLRLFPKDDVAAPIVENGKVFSRRDHFMHAWLAAR